MSRLLRVPLFRCDYNNSGDICLCVGYANFSFLFFFSYLRNICTSFVHLGAACLKHYSVQKWYVLPSPIRNLVFYTTVAVISTRKSVTSSLADHYGYHYPLLSSNKWILGFSRQHNNSMAQQASSVNRLLVSCPFFRKQIWTISLGEMPCQHAGRC